MKKRDFIFIMLILLNFMLLSSKIVYADDIKSFLPEEIKKLNFNMPINEYQQSFPDSKPFIKNDNYVIYSLDIKKDDLWNKAICVFDDDLLTFYSLTIIEIENKVLNKYFINIDTEVCVLINKISKNFGSINKKYIVENKDSDIYYEPLMIWENNVAVIQLSYTPHKILDNVVAPHISLTFSKKGTDYSRFYPKIIIEDNTDVSFNDLLSDEIKKKLYGHTK